MNKTLNQNMRGMSQAIKFLICLLLSVQLNSLLTADAYVLLGRSWPQPSTTFYVDIPGENGLWNDAFEDALNEWSTNTIFQFLIVSGTHSDPCNSSDDRNGIRFDSTDCDDAWGTSTLAITHTWYSGSTIVETDIVFNSNDSWGVYSGAWQQSVSDFRRVAVHELGHAIGLGHEDSGVSTIMATYAGNTTVPQQDDIDGVEAIYGHSENYYRDYDGDGYGDSENFVESVTQPSGYVTDNTDCNDRDSSIYPGAVEIRGDGIDQDCNGSDLSLLITFYQDRDEDGYGNPGRTIESAIQPSGYVTDNTDCNDRDSSIYPGAVEIRGDGIDQDCNESDLPPLIIYYQDYDGDGYGDSENSIESEIQPSGYVTDNTDCNDNDNSIYPGAGEVRGDSIDQDCNGSDLPPLYKYHRDYDGDGYGNPNVSMKAESQPSGFVSDNTDCNDNDSSIYPGAEETRGDGIDQDCNGGDSPILYIYYQDSDKDGYGKPDASIEAESQPQGYVTNNMDCNDENSSIQPEATEYCNGVDDNCNDATDEFCDVPPNKVIQTFPFGTTDNSSPTFEWNEAPTASWYKIYLKNISTDYKFSQWYENEDNFQNYPEVDCSEGECAVTPDVQFENGSYEWWVRGYNDHGNGNWSDGMTFTVQGEDSPPSGISHISPSGQTGDSTPAYTWNEDPLATWYKLWIGNSNKERIYTQWYDAGEICSDGICTVTPEFQLASDDFEWYIKSWNEYGKVWSDGMSLSITP